MLFKFLPRLMCLLANYLLTVDDDDAFVVVVNNLTSEVVNAVALYERRS